MKAQRTLKASEVRERWSEAVNAVANDEERIRIERSGVVVAGLVSARDLEWLAERDRRLAELRGVVAQMRAAFADVPAPDVEREVEQALADVRAENARRAMDEQASPR
jgi:prevent-host-death family protein